MIEKKPHITHRFFTLLLVLAFVLPVGISFVHAAQGHDHSDVCTFAGETHVHETQLDCDLGDLQVVKVDFYAFAKAYTLTAPVVFKIQDIQLEEVYKTSIQVTSSRGPPAS